MKDDLTYLLKQIQYRTMTGENRTHTHTHTNRSIPEPGLGNSRKKTSELSKEKQDMYFKIRIKVH